MLTKIKRFFGDCFGAVGVEDAFLGVIFLAGLGFIGTVIAASIASLGFVKFLLMLLFIVGFVLGVILIYATVWFFMGLYVKLTKPEDPEPDWHYPPD